MTLLACASTPTASSVPAGSDFLLRAGESVTVAGTGFGVRFDVVASDSRCPADVVCITQGDAEAVFTVTQAGQASVQLTLHTEPGRGERATVGAISLSLTRLDPYPYSSRPISPSEYRAWLRVDRAAGI
jgi:hypothetical protein